VAIGGGALANLKRGTMPLIVDNLVTLAFSVHSNPGTFALLLGSGISRAAHIPTGWEIVLELVRRVAAASGEDPGADPISWYRWKFGAEPGYSELLARLALSQSERQALLRGYFEPTEAEAKQGRKAPTAAHKAIARLVADGRVRVILTTNFDRLLERALDDVGISPVVIATPDAIIGAPPLQHSACTIIKINGDFLDTRIRNTEEELAQYPPELCQLLDRVFDEYGLIVCGWSGEWDLALRDALTRRKSRRYSCFWCARGDLTPKAQELATLISAVAVSISDANSFFESLAEKVNALEQLSKPHPLSTPLAVQALKEYIVDERHRIRLHDLVVGATNAPLRAVVEADVSSFSGAELEGRLARYESVSEMIVALVANGVFWDASDGPNDKLWTSVLVRLAKPAFDHPWGVANVAAMKLRRYPACLVLYAAGVAACATGRLKYLRTVLAPSITSPEGGECPTYTLLNPVGLLEHANHALPGKGPLPMHLRAFECLRPLFRGLIPDDNEFAAAFYQLEYLTALHSHMTGQWSVPGLYMLQGGRLREREDVLIAMEKRLSEQKADWAPIASGLLPATVDAVANAQKQLHQSVRERRSRLELR
jgi:hypothetical protein